jgi:hypothetical protein
MPLAEVDTEHRVGRQGKAVGFPIIPAALLFVSYLSFAHPLHAEKSPDGDVSGLSWFKEVQTRKNLIFTSAHCM